MCASDLSGSSAPPRPTLPTTRLFCALQAFGCDGSEQGILSLGNELPTFNIGQNQLCPAFSSHAPACLCILKAHLPLDLDSHAILIRPDSTNAVLYLESTCYIHLIAYRVYESVII